jgi:starvation-inducible DNA-binding protein
MLAENLKVLLSSVYAFAIKAQYFHWNVEGDNFPQYHEFFGNLYEEVNGSIDVIAEHIRTLDTYTPGSFQRFQELSIIEDQVMVPRAELMMTELLSDNEKMLELLNHCFEVAGAEKARGIENYIAERIDAHSKHNWMLKSITKKARS